MSKKELEDKYLTLLDQHLQLKSELNSSEEKHKILSTKLQRIFNQHKSENSCSCKYSGKVTHTLQDVIARQKYKIEDLEMKNLGLLEKIRILKLNLSSQRQFLGSTTNMKRFYSVSGVGSLGTARKIQSHRSVQNNKHLEKIASPSSSAESSSVKIQIEHAADSGDAVDLESSKDSKGIQTNDEERLIEENIIENLHYKISHLEKEFNNAQIKYHKQILLLEEEQKTLVIERDAALSCANRTIQQQLEQADCWNRVSAEQLREILARNTELIMQLSKERKKVSDLELKLKECVYTTQLVDLVYDQLKHNKYVCRVCKTLEEVVEKNGLQATSHSEYTTHLPEFKQQNNDHNVNTAIVKLNAITNGRSDDSVKEFVDSEEETKHGIRKHSTMCRIPLPLPMNVADEFNTNQQTTSIVKTPALSLMMEDDDDVVTNSRRDSGTLEDKVNTEALERTDAIDANTVQGDNNFEQQTQHNGKSEGKTSLTSNETSQRTKSISHGTYTIQKPKDNGNQTKPSRIKQKQPSKHPSEVSDKTEEGLPSMREECHDEVGEEGGCVDDTYSVSDSSHSAVTLSEGERPVFDDTSTSMDYSSSNIESSGWSQQFYPNTRFQNTSSDSNPNDACVLDRAKRVLSAVSEVLTECRDLQGKTRLISTDANVTLLH